MGRLTQTSTAYPFIPGKTFTVKYAYDKASNRISMGLTARHPAAAAAILVVVVAAVEIFAGGDCVYKIFEAIGESGG